MDTFEVAGGKRFVRFSEEFMFSFEAHEIGIFKIAICDLKK